MGGALVELVLIEESRDDGMWPITETSPDPAMVLHHMTHGMALTGHCAAPGPEPFEQVLVMSPVIAGMVASRMPTKKAMKEHLFRTARVPMSWYPPHRHDATRERARQLGITIKDGLVPVAESPDTFIILCAGGKGGLQSCGLSTMLGRSVTKKIADVPDR